MEDWKRAVVFGAMGAGALLLLSRRRAAGMALAGVGVAVLAAEYPAEFDRLCEEAQDYIYRGTQIVNLVTRVVERFSQRRGLAEESSPYIT